jgi:predicted DNA-binding transcriptional regulator YafY
MNLFKIARLERRVVRIVYRWGVERDIEVYDFDERYVDAFCRLRQDPRAFRIDRILDAELLPEKFEIDPGVAAQIASTGWAHRSAAWRRTQMWSVMLDEECDLIFR